MPKLLDGFQGGVFESFVSESVPHAGVTETEKPVVVLKDTGLTQTILLNSAPPLSEVTDLHNRVLVKCAADTRCQSLPLHRVCLKSKYVTGDVTVGIVDKTPIESVSVYRVTVMGYGIVRNSAQRLM